MKENPEYLNEKVLNICLMLFSFAYCLVFDKWIFMIPLFIIGTRGNNNTLIIITSIIYFFCLFRNWLLIILLSLSFSFYLIVYKLLDSLCKKEKVQYVLAVFIVTFLLYKIQSIEIKNAFIFSIMSVFFSLLFDFIIKTNINRNMFVLEVVSIQLGKDEKYNGDYFDTLEWNNKQYLFLSDGIGQGKEALKISKNLIKKIKQLIINGYNVRKAIEVANEQFLDDESLYASLDVVECFFNEINFYKKGAETSYLLRNKQIQKINEYNLPLGIKDRQFKPKKQQILANDVLIMCSDGVILSYPNFEEEIATKNDEDNLINWIENISTKARNKLMDDFSIILIKFNEKKQIL